MKEPTVYIISNKLRTVLYTGVTSNLEARMLLHKAGRGSEFATKYKCTDLLYYEKLADMNQVISREKNIKKWKRQWKLELIHAINSDLTDLAKDWHDKDRIEEIRNMDDEDLF